MSCAGRVLFTDTFVLASQLRACLCSKRGVRVGTVCDFDFPDRARRASSAQQRRPMEQQGKKSSGHAPLSAAGGSNALGGRRLIVVSNRAPIRVVHEGGKQRIEPTVGGVGSTFLRLLEHMGGVWVAWSGTQTRTPGRLMMPPGADPARFQIVFCPLRERDISHY